MSSDKQENGDGSNGSGNTNTNRKSMQFSFPKSSRNNPKPSVTQNTLQDTSATSTQTVITSTPTKQDETFGFTDLTPVLNSNPNLTPTPDTTPKATSRAEATMEPTLTSKLEDTKSSQPNNSNVQTGAKLQDLSQTINTKSIKKGKTPLQKAIEAGNVGMVNDILSLPQTDVNATDNSGNTALFAAAVHPTETYVKLLAKKSKLNLQHQNIYGETALHVAVNNNSLPAVSALIDADINVNLKTNLSKDTLIKGQAVKGQQSALHYAFNPNRKLNGEIITALMVAKSDLTSLNQDYQTPLMLALSHPQIAAIDFSILGLLIKNSKSMRDINLRTSLHAASLNQAITDELFHQLINVDSSALKSSLNDIDFENMTALCHLVSRKALNKIKTLLELKPNLNKGFPLHLAIELGQYEIAELLIKQGADVNLPNKNGLIPLKLAINYAKANKNNGVSDTRFIELLASHNALFVKKGEAFLADALRDKEFAIAKLLIQNGADFVTQNTHTPMYHAVDNGQLEIVTMLKTRGVTFAKKEQFVALALQKKYSDLALYLISNGADVETEYNGSSPLVWAAHHGNNDALVALATKKELHLKNGELKDGELILKKAALNNHPETLIKAIELGANPATLQLYPATKGKGFKIISFSSVESSLHDDGVDQTHQFEAGDTLLHYAIRTRNEKLATICLEKNPEMLNILNDAGMSPAYLVIKLFDGKMAKILGKYYDKIQDAPAVSRTYLKTAETKGKSISFIASSRGFTRETLKGFFTDEKFVLSNEQEKIKLHVDKNGGTKKGFQPLFFNMEPTVSQAYVPGIPSSFNPVVASHSPTGKWPDPNAVDSRDGKQEIKDQVTESAPVTANTQVNEPVPVTANPQVITEPVTVNTQVTEPAPVTANTQVNEPVPAPANPQVTEPVPVTANPQITEPAPVPANTQVSEPASVNTNTQVATSEPSDNHIETNQDVVTVQHEEDDYNKKSSYGM